MKGRLNEYGLDLLRQRSLEARRAMAKRGELIVIAPLGFKKTEDHRLEKDPDRRVQEAICLVFDQFERIGSVRQTLLWFHEHDLELPCVIPRGEARWKRPIYGTRYEAGVERTSARRKPREQWLAFILGTHEGYVEWVRFERIQRAISCNLHIASRPLAPAREGHGKLTENLAVLPRRPVYGTFSAASQRSFSDADAGENARIPVATITMSPLCRVLVSRLMLLNRHTSTTKRGSN